MRLTLLKNELRWGGTTYKAGDEFDAEEIGEVKAWFALGWVKKTAATETKMIQAEPVAPMTAETNSPLTPAKANINPATGKRYYRRRDMKAEE